MTVYNNNNSFFIKSYSIYGLCAEISALYSTLHPSRYLVHSGVPVLLCRNIIIIIEGLSLLQSIPPTT